MKFFTLIALLFFVTAGQAVAQKNSVDKKALNNELGEINERFEDSYVKYPSRISSSDPRNSLGEIDEMTKSIALVDFSGCKLLFVSTLKQSLKDGEVVDIQVRIYFSLKDLELKRTRLTYNDGVFGFMVTTKGRKVGFEQLTDGKRPSSEGDRQTESRNFVGTTAIWFKSTAQPEVVQHDLGRAIEICGLL